MPKISRTPCIECGRPSFSRGLCSMHYARVQRAGRLSEFPSSRTDVTIRNALGEKKCTACKRWFNTDLFPPHKGAASDGLHPICRRCHVTTKYGLSSLDVENMLIAQGGLCAMCFEPLGNRFHVDHNHNCCPGRRACGKCVRGLLHPRCNTALGFYENVELSTRARDYVARYEVMAQSR